MNDVLDKIIKSAYWFIAVVIISVYFLTISLVYPTNVVDNMKLLKGSVIGLFYGITAWMTHNLVIMRSYKTTHQIMDLWHVEKRYYEIQTGLFFIFFLGFIFFVIM